MNQTRLLLLVALVGTQFACASTPAQRRSTPTVTITQTSKVVPLRVAPGTGVPVDYRLHVTNPSDQSVTLTIVEIETVGFTGAYTMKRMRHRFAKVIPAHGTETIALRAWVQPLQESQAGDVGSPVMLRGIARFDAMGNTIRTAFAGRVQ